jgi:sugar phosphate isomerase/epimerase
MIQSASKSEPATKSEPGIKSQSAINSQPEIKSGLLSVTFRQLPVEQIVSLAVSAGLESIEWGGDIHVPPGNLARARHVKQLCDDAKLEISAYGSYYRAGDPAQLAYARAVPAEPAAPAAKQIAAPSARKTVAAASSPAAAGPSFDEILETALALGAGTIRVWAGNIASAAATPDDRRTVVADLIRVCDLASRSSITIGLEFHSGTLTDDIASCLDLIRQVNRPNLKSFWQPPNGMIESQALDTLGQLTPHLGNIHVFHWWPDPRARLPLADGAARWRKYLKQAGADGVRRFASLEFVRGDDVEQFKRDAATLRALLTEIRKSHDVPGKD